MCWAQAEAPAHKAVAAARDGVPEETNAPAGITDASDDPADLQTLLDRKLIATGGRNKGRQAVTVSPPPDGGFCSATALRTTWRAAKLLLILRAAPFQRLPRTPKVAFRPFLEGGGLNCYRHPGLSRPLDAR